MTCCCNCAHIDRYEIIVTVYGERFFVCPLYPSGDGIGWDIDCYLGCDHFKEDTAEDTYYLVECAGCSTRLILPWRRVIDMSTVPKYKNGMARILVRTRSDDYEFAKCECDNDLFRIKNKKVL